MGAEASQRAGRGGQARGNLALGWLDGWVGGILLGGRETLVGVGARAGGNPKLSRDAEGSPGWEGSEKVEEQGG